MLKVKIESQVLRPLSFTYRGTQTPVQEQTGWANFYDRNGNLEPHPRPIAIRLGNGQQPYPNGEYTIHPSSLYSGDFNTLKVSPELKLVPAAGALKAA